MKTYYVDFNELFKSLSDVNKLGTLIFGYTKTRDKDENSDIKLVISASKNEVLYNGFALKITNLVSCLKQFGIYKNEIEVSLNVKQKGEKLIKNVENDEYYYTPKQWKKIELLNEYFKKNNIKFKIEDMFNDFSLEQVKNANQKITKQANTIKEKSFSPLEKLMYAYRTVTRREYTFEDENEGYAMSRSPYGTQTSNKIVCVGYELWLKAIMEEVGD